MKRKLALAATAAIITIIMIALAGCGGTGDGNEIAIDENCRATIAGDYQVTGLEANYWHLHISDGVVDETGADESGEVDADDADNADDGDNPHDISIYDNEAGNPGIQGQIVKLDETTIRFRYDPDYFDNMPNDKWQLDGDYLELTYELKDDMLTLTNNGASLVFQRDADWQDLCMNWKPESEAGEDVEEVIDTFQLGDESLTFAGWVYNPALQGWEEVSAEAGTYRYSDDCIFTEQITTDDYNLISKEEFRKFLDSDKAGNTVIQLEILGDKVQAVRLVTPKESMLPD